MEENIKTRPEEVRVPFEEMVKVFNGILLKNYFTKDKAKICARLFAENSLDGVYTHGVNRFAPFIKYVKEKVINAHAEPSLKKSTGAVEQWDGNLGPGPLNALKCTDRAMELAKEYGIGCVALANTNHWMRAGYYGWKAAKAGYVLIAWTNTIGIMPAWGAIDPKLGNNPVVFALPYNNEAIVLDMAVSQFSYGILETYKRRDEQLSYPGGFNKDGMLSTNSAEILEARRLLPIGYWKGAGLSLMFDLLATVLSAGFSTSEISMHQYEHAMSQIFIAIDLSRVGTQSSISKTINSIIDDYHNSQPESDKSKIYYPGERVLQTRNENLEYGIPVNKKFWEKINSL
jgi:3-dehydro-L-gulonate 2-dehydrogenase